MFSSLKCTKIHDFIDINLLVYHATVKSQIFVRYLFSYLCTFEKKKD